MNWLSLLLAFGLLTLWIVSLSTGAAAAWFEWLVFALAVVLLVNSLAGLEITNRRFGRPV